MSYHNESEGMIKIKELCMNGDYKRLKELINELKIDKKESEKLRERVLFVEFLETLKTSVR